MKIKLTLLAAILFCGLAAQAQTNTNLFPTPPTISYSVTNPPTIEGGVQEIWNAVESGVTNFYFTADYMYASDLKEHNGGGAGVFWPLSTYVVTGLRLDWLDGGFWMPNGNATLQVPIKLTSWLTIKPFYYAGIGIPVSGAKIEGLTVPGHVTDNNGNPTAIYGPGIAVRIYTGQNFFIDVAGDDEVWSGFPGRQYRIGAIAQIPWDTVLGKLAQLF